MYTEYYFDVNLDDDAECESDARSKLLPNQWTEAERNRNVAGIFRAALLSAVLICDLKFGLNPFTILATVFSIPAMIHLRD